MTKEIKQDLTLLQCDEHYYGDVGRKYLSNSDIMALLQNPSKFKVHEDTSAMVFGRYFHQLILEPEKAKETVIVDASTRGTKLYKEAAEGQILLLKSEAELAQRLAKKLLGNIDMYDLIRASGNEYEQPGIGTIHGELWKAKADVVGSEFVLDLKTTSKIASFPYSARKYHYDSQAYIYRELFGKPMVFLVACKDTEQIGMFTCSADFYESGYKKCLDAVIAYRKYFGENPSEDINDYYLKSEL